MVAQTVKKVISGVQAAFRAVKEEIASHGGLLGTAKHYAQAFATLVGEHPAFRDLKDVIGEFRELPGKVAESVAEFGMQPQEAIPVRANRAPSGSLQRFNR